MNIIGKLIFVQRKDQPAWPAGVYADTVEAYEHSEHIALCGDKAVNDG